MIACCYRCGEKLLFTSSVLDSTIASTRGSSIPTRSTDALQVLSTVSQRVAVQMSVENLNKIALTDVLSRMTKGATRGGGPGVEVEDEENESSSSLFQDDLVLVVQWMKTVEESDGDEQCRALSRVMIHNPILNEVLRGAVI